MRACICLLVVLAASAALAARANAAPLYTLTDIADGTFQAKAINNAGQVAGSVTTGTNTRAAIAGPGGMTLVGPVGHSSAGSGINDAGVVVGTLDGGTAAARGFVYSNGTTRELGTLGGATSTANDINAAGQVTGGSLVANGPNHAYRLDGSTMTELGTAGGRATAGTAINNAGHVIGTVSSLSTPAFFWDGTMHGIGTLGGTITQAQALNDADQVVGASSGADGNRHAFLWQGGVMTDLGTLGGTTSSAAGINNAGQIVGTSYLADGTQRHAFLYDGSTMLDLNTLLDPQNPNAANITLTDAYGINDHGQILAYSRLTNHTYVLTEVPEPASLAMLAGGLPVLLLARRRRTC